MAVQNFGKQMHLQPPGSGNTLTKLGELLTLKAPAQTVGTIDVTTHDSVAGAMEFIAAGVYDPGAVSGQINFIAGSAGDDAFVAAVIDGELRDFKIVVKSAADTEDMTFSGFVTEYGVDDLPVEGKQTASFGIKVSGPIAQAASA